MNTSVTSHRRQSTVSNSRLAPQWKARASFGEGFANISEGAGLACALVAIVAALVCTLCASDIFAVRSIVADESRYLNAGGDILVAQRSQGTIDAKDCTALDKVTGVRAATALSVIPDGVTISGRPDSHQTLVTATAGILDFFDLPYPGEDGVIVSQRIADRWKWAPGSRLQFEAASAAVHHAPSGVLRVAAVADLAKLGDAESTAILMLRAATGQADFCYVRVQAQYRADITKALPALLGDRDSARIQVSDLLSQGAFTVDPAAVFDHRSTRDVGLLAGTIVALLWAIVGWLRRGRSALYASLGVPYPGGVLIRWTEGALVMTLGVLWGTVLAVTIAVRSTDISTSLALNLALRQGAVALAVALAGVVVAGLWRPATMASLKERQ